MPEPIVLAIDTATETCSVALLAARCVERSEEVGQGHSQRVLPMVDAVLGEQGLSLADVDVIAFGAGPGSFTGLRIACGVAQGLAWGAGKPVVAIANLRALAAEAFAAGAQGDVVLAAIDARMDEAYCAVYRRGPVPLELAPAALVKPAALMGLVEEHGASIIAGNALTRFPAVWDRAQTQARLPLARAGAARIAALARVDAKQGRSSAPHTATPLYVRDRVALTIAERQARQASA